VKVLLIAILASLTIGLTVAANLLLKRGASAPASEMLLGIIGWKTFAGWVAFGFALIAYTMLLKHVPLHFAASITSAKFIGVILAAWFILNERVVTQQWIGILLIAAGITVISLAARESTDEDEQARNITIVEEAP
jgi:drug/metabolite transporter (DMT)-like permease